MSRNGSESGRMIPAIVLLILAINQNTMLRVCSLTRVAQACTQGISWSTPSLMRLRDFVGRLDIMYCIRWVGIVSGYRRKIMRLKQVSRRNKPYLKILRTSKISCSALVQALIGRVKLTPVIQRITSGRSGFLRSYLSAGLRIKKIRSNGGAQKTEQCLRTNR